MVHESLLVVTSRGESIGKVIHNDGDDTFLVEREKVYPKDFEFHYEGTTGVCEDGALLFTVTECPEEEPVAADPIRTAGSGRGAPVTSSTGDLRVGKNRESEPGTLK
jgi:hypothetical protein